MVDWGDGDYGRTASVLAPAAQHLVEFAGVRSGQRLLDVACGTGNGALAAAEIGAQVTGVDASPGLVSAAKRRAEEAGIRATFLEGDAGALPVADAAHDATVSVFGVIFADDPRLAAAEMLRATRPGGVVALASWLATGAIHDAGVLLREAFPAPEGPPARWGDPAWVRRVMLDAGARDPRHEWGELVFHGASPEAWFAEQEHFHPMWRWARSALDSQRWERLRRESVAALSAGNEDADAFRVTSGYLLTRVEVGATA
jgi:SAM-dependent methyltransferase